MSKSFVLDRSGQTPQLLEQNTDKIPIYDSKADAEADLANIEEGGIVATKDTGATEKVVDVVQDGNMNPVTSNAVADMFAKKNIDNSFAFSTTGDVDVTAQVTGICYITIRSTSTTSTDIAEDDVVILKADDYAIPAGTGSGTHEYRSFTVFIRKGHRYRWYNGTVLAQHFVPFDIQ